MPFIKKIGKDARSGICKTPGSVGNIVGSIDDFVQAAVPSFIDRPLRAIFDQPSGAGEKPDPNNEMASFGGLPTENSTSVASANR